jgi:hypothetical protein
MTKSAAKGQDGLGGGKFFFVVFLLEAGRSGG